MALKEGEGGGVRRTILGVKRWPSKNSFKFYNEGICNNANSLPECQKPACLMFIKIKFLGEASPQSPYSTTVT